MRHAASAAPAIWLRALKREPWDTASALERHCRIFSHAMACQFYDAHSRVGHKVKTVKVVDAEKFIATFAQHLKRKCRFETPKWADMAKTTRAKELPPLNPDWLYVCFEPMVRKIYIRGGLLRVEDCSSFLGFGSSG